MKFKLFLLLLFLTGCSSSIFSNKNTSNLPIIEDRNINNKNTKTNVVEDPKIEIIRPSTKDRKDPNKLFENYSVYFDLDEYTVKEQYSNILRKHGEFLAKNQDEFVFIEGHTDERGGKEYNLALGQRRANAVRVELLKYGARDSQLEAYSYGSEKPKAIGSTEEAWSQNRRVDLHYKN